MATVKKGTYTRPIPESAKIIEKKGKKFARFKHNGKMLDAPLTADGTKCRMETAEYYVRYKNSAGKWKREKAYTDHDASLSLAVKIEARIARQAEGLVDPFEKHTRCPILEHVDDFERHLEAKGDTWKHVTETAQKVRKIIAGCNFETLADMASGAVESYLATERRKEMAAQTSNHHLKAIKQFSKWLVRERRKAEDVLAHLSTVSVTTDRRHDRRALEVDEIGLLLSAAETGPTVEGVTGPERAIFYTLGLWTGYRRGELASLTVKSFNLDGETPTVTVEAAYSKHRRKDTIPLHAEVARRVAQYVARYELGPDDPLFDLRTSGGHWRKTSKMMREDLASARTQWIEKAKDDPHERARREASEFLVYQNEAGFFADAHALRHTFVSGLGRAGVDPKMAQSLARHSDINLTMNTYTHLRLADQVSAIASLPAPPSRDEKETNRATAERVQELRATGTESPNGHEPAILCLPPACQGFGTGVHCKAQTHTPTAGRTGEGRGAEETPQSVKEKRLGTSVHAKPQIHPTGFEPVTSGSVDRCSVQLS